LGGEGGVGGAGGMGGAAGRGGAGGGRGVPARRVGALVAAALVAYGGALVAGGLHARPGPVPARHAAPFAQLPRIAIAPSRGVDRRLDRETAIAIVSDLQRRRLPVGGVRRVTLWLEAKSGQAAIAIARLDGRRAVTVGVLQTRGGYGVGRIRR